MLPRLSDTFHSNQSDFFDAFSRLSHVVTSFFIDTSLNVIETIQYIYSILDTGSICINLGPPLWAPTGVVPELSLDEVIKVVESVGFELLLAKECGGLSRWSNYHLSFTCQAQDPVRTRYSPRPDQPETFLSHGVEVRSLNSEVDSTQHKSRNDDRIPAENCGSPAIAFTGEIRLARYDQGE